jgi:adenylylsulfate kinase
MVLWFTGLSGSGKSTLARTLESWLQQRALPTCLLDGDTIRHGLCRDLGFSAADRQENIRRISEVAKLFVDAGLITLTAVISPIRADRQKARERIGRANFIEIYCRCPLEVCEQRDVKGMYKRARAGLIAEFTGISSPYEEPDAADLVLETATCSVEESLALLVAHLQGPLQNRIPSRNKFFGTA